MDQQPQARSKRRQGQALNIAAQIIQASSIVNKAISSKEIYNIVISNKRMSNKGEFSLNTEQSWRKFLAIGHARSLWDRKQIHISGYTGTNSTYYYYYAHFVDEETMEIGNLHKWTRNDSGAYVMETREVISNKRD